jgi:gliding motility-associated-like protein
MSFLKTSLLGVFMLLVGSEMLWSQNRPVEICENAKDDDGDGLIDLNDTADCKCKVLAPVSLIPNPSFESTNCCPQRNSQLNCADTWIQASEATTDLLHTCGWLGWPQYPPPQPFPDGNSIVGFRNGRFNNNPNPNWKEYTGACLLSPLKANVTYRFKFWIGFSNGTNSPPTNVVFYGTPDCKYLPFGRGDQQFGCPTNGPGWVELGRVAVSGVNEWRTYSVTCTPKEDMYAMCIGPDCVKLEFQTADTYYFFDNLILDEVQNFDYDITPEGNPCGKDYVLKVPEVPDYRYQWFKNGIALIGEIQSKLKVKTGEGEYRVRVESKGDCRITQIFHYLKPRVFGRDTVRICPETTYKFKRQILAREGAYVDTFVNRDNCDSIVFLQLKIDYDLQDSVIARVFEGEAYKVVGNKFTRPGNYVVNIDSDTGCDSTVFLNLNFFKIYIPSAFSPNNDRNNDGFGLQSAGDVVRIRTFRVYNRWGDLVFRVNDVPPDDPTAFWNGTFQGRTADNGLYLYYFNLDLVEGRSLERRGEVMLVR